MADFQAKSEPEKKGVALLLSNGGRTRLIRRLLLLGLLAVAFSITVDLLRHGIATARDDIWDIVATALLTAIIIDAFFAFPLWLVQEHVRRKRDLSRTDGA